MPVSRSGCLFVHIPKCAGTSVEVALGVADEYPEIGLKATSTRPNLATLFGGGLQHLTRREIGENYPEVAARPSFFSFSIVRDPVDRFLSHFIWKHYRFAEMLPNDDNVLRLFLAEVDDLVAQSRTQDVFRNPFDGFEYREGDSATFPITDIRRHLLPQCSYLFDRGAVPIDSIYPITAMKELERDLQQRDAITGSIPQRMVGREAKRLRQTIPADAKHAIQDVYRYDVRLHARVREISLGNSASCRGAAIAVKDIADGNSVPPADASVLPIPRKLWMYWHQGWEQAPPLVQKCAESWLKRNPTWEIHRLTAKDLHDAIEIPAFYTDRFPLTLATLSDVIRLHLLARYGGVWVDATTWCVRPLDDWLGKVVVATGFFAYARPTPDRPLSSWFLAATPRHPILERWETATDELWRQVLEDPTTLDVTNGPGSRGYFWLHGLFADLLLADPTVAELWDKGSQISADAPHYLQKVGLLKVATADVECHIRNKFTNVYKLDRRIELPSDFNGLVLDALFRTL